MVEYEVTDMLFQTPEPDERESDVLAQIERARAELASLLQLTTPQRWVGRLRRSQLARAIQGSNSIEGYIASLDDAAAILEGLIPKGLKRICVIITGSNIETHRLKEIINTQL